MSESDLSISGRRVCECISAGAVAALCHARRELDGATAPKARAPRRPLIRSRCSQGDLQAALRSLNGSGERLS
jgi:uncharacterized protein (DUF849 family)